MSACLRLLALTFLLQILPAPAAPASSPIDNLFLGSSAPRVLEPDEAFGLALEVVDANTLKASFTVARGHYLYRDRIHFKLEGSNPRINTILPEGEEKQDPNFGKTRVFHQNFNAVLEIMHGGPPPATLTVQASYQGCSEQGLCYAPIRKSIRLTLPQTQAGNEVAVAENILRNGKLGWVVLSFFGFGLFLSFTPCVLPMIPILSSIIVHRDLDHPASRRQAFVLSLAYTLGMALTYTLAGIAAGFSGHLMSNSLQTPWVLGLGALLFVLLALSMFGLYELRLPSALETRAANLTNHFRGGHFMGVLGMGAVSSLIMSPCVAAPLAGALLYIGQTHDVALGGLALFALSLGMGLPLLLLGASAHAWLPKAGAWMNIVRNFFGVVMLGMAIWLIGPIIPAPLQMGLYAALLIITAIGMRALDSLPPHAERGQKLWKGMGILLLVGGTGLLLGALAGNKNPLQPLLGQAPPEKRLSSLPFQPVSSLEQLDRALEQARGHYVMLDFYADWCTSCQEYEHFTFSDPRVVAMLEKVTLLRADVTRNHPDDLTLMERFGLYGPPGIVFFDRNGTELKPLRVVGYQDASRFLVTLNALHATHDGTCPAPLTC